MYIESSQWVLHDTEHGYTVACMWIAPFVHLALEKVEGAVNAQVTGTVFVTVYIEEHQYLMLPGFLVMDNSAPSSCPCGVSPDERLSETTIEHRADQLKALANPVRLRMVDLIYHGGGEICVCEFMDHFDLSQPTISHHLKVLREAGLIQSRKEGTMVRHRVDETAFTALSTLMDRFSTVREPDAVLAE
jgi:ArsR family transcriptional regulator